MAGPGFPVLNVGTTPAAVEIQALAPGLDPAKLEITVDRGLLVIAGERRSQLPAEGQRASVYASERFTGPFRRVISLPEDADPSKVEASYRNGVLKLVVSRLEAAKPRQVAINR